MKRRLLYITTTLLLLLTQTAMAQEMLRVTRAESGVTDGNLVVALDLRLDEVELRPNDLLILTPILTDESGTEKVRLPQIVLSGKTRYKVLKRTKDFRHPVPYDKHPYYEDMRDNGRPLSINYSQVVPLQSWMRKGQLRLISALTGCAYCDKETLTRTIIDRLVKEPYKPDYKLTYIVPEAEPVKARAEEHTAQLNFVVAKHDIVRGLGNNALILDEADKILGDLMGNKDLTLTNLQFTGWASPEGNQSSNQALSERRAHSFADYLIQRHGLDRSRVRIVGGGEDWRGVRDLVADSYLADRDQVLRIIDSGIDYDARDARLRQLSRGATYTQMLQEIYPRVRRTVYRIAYEVRAFDVEEAKEVIKRDPKLLSLNEMYLVAQTYAPDSPDFKEVFDIATRIYPDQPIAINNASAADIEGGNYEAAIHRMQKISGDARVWNNMGVAYARSGNLETARRYLEQATQRGDQLAKHNLEELDKVIEDQKGRQNQD